MKKPISISLSFLMRKEKKKLRCILIIHPVCIKEVFSDATVFIADFGLSLPHPVSATYLCHHHRHQQQAAKQGGTRPGSGPAQDK